LEGNKYENQKIRNVIKQVKTAEKECSRWAFSLSLLLQDFQRHLIDFFLKNILLKILLLKI